MNTTLFTRGSLNQVLSHHRDFINNNGIDPGLELYRYAIRITNQLLPSHLYTAFLTHIYINMIYKLEYLRIF